ncbi:efflux RND transporter periplasmic adaptor subunit [Motilimonas pumila]|uniref:Efflux RND transporter periplasmic adaptor subunit n=1 Tax=Motilimonas pumila TaxID=2303987 RepID=A0A418YB57_9GAMM|nr:efflux RND transporter periplasmic adaptor subunit [Motilimonas pumila]RJG40214.1 efflux RND transporter periplasmic adaptor subunit [Motilimonas pumila]
MKWRKILPIALSLLLVACAGTLVATLAPEPTPPAAVIEVKQPVTVSLVKPQAYQPVIALFGFSRARWPVEIKATSSAKVQWLNAHLEPGALVKQGDVLAKIDTTHLSSQLAQARSAVTQAELNLEREQHERTVALKMLSQRKSSAYARREPQIAFAKAALQQARQAYVSAQQHFKDATVVAPFDAVIINRFVSPGQQVAVEQPLFQLASSASLDIHVAVPEQLWQRFSAALEQPDISVVDRQHHKRQGTLRFVTPEVDSISRQRQVVLAVAEPYRASPRLLPNQQVSVEVRLEQRDGVMALPLSALTRDGDVWTLDDDNKLRLETIDVLKETPSAVFAVFQLAPLQARRVVTYPLLSMISGTQVAPKMARGDNDNMEQTP